MKINKIKMIYILIVIFTVLLSMNFRTNAAIIRGNGKEGNPYIIDMDTAITSQGGQVSYIEIPITLKDGKVEFYFKIEGSDPQKCNGTYCVEYDEENKIVRFNFINAEKRVVYIRNSGDSYYVQAGTEPDTTTHPGYAEKEIKFTISSKEKFKDPVKYVSYGMEKSERNYFTLENAPVPGGDPEAPHLNYFVFTKGGTIEDLYTPVSNNNCDGTTFAGKKYYEIFDTRFLGFLWITGQEGFASLILEPYPTIGNADKPVGYIRFDDFFGDLNNPRLAGSCNEYTADIIYRFTSKEAVVEEKPNVIEVAITWILIGIGEVFMFVIRLFLGSSVTMDSIIFNRYEDVVVDLRGKVGIFADKEVKQIINVMYSGFEFLAIAIFIVILLYLGIQILLSVGTEKQSKCFKHLQNWLIGVLILFLFPSFFPFITDISNAIVSYIGKSAEPMYTQYNVIAILDDESILGENAHTVKLDEVIMQGISDREALLAKKQEELDEKRNKWLLLEIQVAAKKVEFEQKEEQILQKQTEVGSRKETIDAWDRHMDESFAITANSGSFPRDNPRYSSGVGPEKFNSPQDIMNLYDFGRYTNDMMNYIEQNRTSWSTTNDNELAAKQEEFNRVWDWWRNIYYRTNCVDCRVYPDGTEQHSPACESSKKYPTREVIPFTNEYKELQLELGRLETELKTLETELEPYRKLKSEIDKLEKDIEILRAYKETEGQVDLMSEMRSNAGKSGRVIYAIVWLVLMFQMIAVLTLYYKRIIMTAILIMIFPIVMITYAIDKINDGTAQSFEAWTKEFTINIFVQIVHAVIYVVLIKTGLEIYKADNSNWLFLFLSALFLFPGERLLRMIFGLEGTLAGTLKNDVVGAALMAKKALKGGARGAKGAVNLTKKGYNSAKNFAKDSMKDGFKNTVKGRAKSAKDKVKESWHKFGSAAADRKSESDNKRQRVADRKHNAREMNIRRRREMMQNASVAKKAMLKAVNAASMVRSGMYKAGNVGRKLKRGYHKAQNSFAGKSLKLAGASLRKLAGLSAGIAYGATEAVENGGKGLVNSINHGVSQGRDVKQMISGVSSKPKPKTTVPDYSKPKKTARKTAANMLGGQKPKKVPKKQGAQSVSRGSTKAGSKTKRRISSARRNVKVNKKTNYQETQS